MLTSLVSGNDLPECLNPTEETFYPTAVLVEFQIEPEWPPSLWMFPGSLVNWYIFPRSLVNWYIALDPSFPIVLTNLPSIVGCICGSNRWMNLHIGNLKCFEGWFIEPEIMDIGRGNGAGKGETIPIDQSAQFVPLYLFL
jgi:hypothetical protein